MTMPRSQWPGPLANLAPLVFVAEQSRKGIGVWAEGESGKERDFRDLRNSAA